MPEAAVATPPPAAPPAATPAPAVAPAAPTPRDATPVESPRLETDFESQFPEADGEDTTPPEPRERRLKPAAPEKPSEKPAAAAPAKPGDDPYALPKDVAESKDLKRLREFAYSQNKAAKTLEKEITALKSKVVEFEATVPKTIQERDALAAKVAAAEKMIASSEERLRFLDFKSSDEYKTKYEKPYVEAYSRAATDIGKCQLQYDDPAGTLDENGQVKKLTRTGTESDLQWLLSQDRPTARRESKKHFPDDWEEVMALYNEIVPLRTSAIKAEADYKANWKTIEQNKVAAKAQQDKTMEEAWDKVNQELSEKNPEFAPRENDADGNAMLEKGFSLADLFFTDQREKLKLDQRVLLDAHVRNRVAAHPRLVRDLKAAQAKITQLEADIAELRGSKPGAPRPASPESPTTEESEGALAAFEKKM